MIINCLICRGEILPKVSWSTLLSRPKDNYLCDACFGKLPFIHGETCEKCSRPFSQLDPQYRTASLCFDCIRWNEAPGWSGCFEKNHSIFIYDDFLKEVISQYKFRGDYILAKAFSFFIKEKLKFTDSHLLVPIPLSQERLYERGFNQSAALVREAGFTPTNLLERLHSEKQSKKSRKERIHLQQVFRPISNAEFQNKKIVLIDDIYTTGSTLYHAAKVLRAAGAASVSSFTLARG